MDGHQRRGCHTGHLRSGRARVWRRGGGRGGQRLFFRPNQQRNQRSTSCLRGSHGQNGNGGGGHRYLARGAAGHGQSDRAVRAGQRFDELADAGRCRQRRGQLCLHCQSCGDQSHGAHSLARPGYSDHADRRPGHAPDADRQHVRDQWRLPVWFHQPSGRVLHSLDEHQSGVAPNQLGVTRLAHQQRFRPIPVHRHERDQRRLALLPRKFALITWPAPP